MNRSTKLSQCSCLQNKTEQKYITIMLPEFEVLLSCIASCVAVIRKRILKNSGTEKLITFIYSLINLFDKRLINSHLINMVRPSNYMD